MTPDRMRGWLRKRPAGATRVRLQVERLTGPEQVEEWDSDQITEMGTDHKEDIASHIMNASAEYQENESEPQKFLIQWIGNRDQPLKVTTHRTKPKSEEVEPEPDSLTGENLTRYLLEAHQEKDQLLMKSIKTIVDAYEKTTSMLTERLEAAYKAAEERTTEDAKPALVLPAEPTAEAREEMLQRTEALKVFTDKGPDILELILALAANRFLPDSEQDTETMARAIAKGGNGAA